MKQRKLTPKPPQYDIHGKVCIHKSFGSPECGKPVDVQQHGWLCVEHAQMAYKKPKAETT